MSKNTLKLTDFLGSWKGNSFFSCSFCCCWTFSNCCCCFCWRIKSRFFSSAAVKSKPSVLIFDVERLKFIFIVIKPESGMVAMASDNGRAQNDKIKTNSSISISHNLPAKVYHFILQLLTWFWALMVTRSRRRTPIHWKSHC